MERSDDSERNAMVQEQIEELTCRIDGMEKYIEDMRKDVNNLMNHKATTYSIDELARFANMANVAVANNQ